MTHVIRPATPSDEPFLWEMLREALFVPPGEPPFDPSVVRTEPRLAELVDGFGRRDGDRGSVAEVDGRPVGAAWLRLVPGGYAHVADDVPELSIALRDGFRGHGIGSALLAAVVAGVERIAPGISLSCDDRNPAVRLYRRVGFEVVRHEPPHTLVMLRELRDDPMPPMAFGVAP